MFRISNTKMLVCDMAGTIIQERGIVYNALFNTIRLIDKNLSRSNINKFYGFNKTEVIDHFVDKKK